MGASCSCEQLDYFESEADIAKLVRGMHRWMLLNVRDVDVAQLGYG